MPKRKGKIFVISAPSGSGKTTLAKKLVKKDRNLVQSVSMTTRRPRNGEKQDKDYRFVSDKKFKGLIKEKKFLEWAINFGNFYGTPRRFVEQAARKGKDTILSIDVQGAMQVKKTCPGAVFIFIAPPSIKELRKRLRKRNTEGVSTINERLKVAKKELTYKHRYDYVVVNDSITKALRKLKTIIAKERCKV